MGMFSWAGRQEATHCSVCWGCSSTSLQQDLPDGSARKRCDNRAVALGKSKGNHELNASVIWDGVFQTSWFVWQWISSIFHQQKNVNYEFKMQGMSAYKNCVEIPTLQCIHSSKILLAFNFVSKRMFFLFINNIILFITLTQCTFSS